MKYLVILSIAFLVSCTGTTGRTFNELENGMSQEAAMQKLGKACSVTQKGDYEMHKYTNLYGLVDKDGCNSCNKTVGKCDYYVIYQNGKLLKYGTIAVK